MKKYRRIVLGLLVLVMCFSLVSCTAIDKGLIKMGFRNEEFDYIKNNKVDKIIIQSARDTGFRFIVTDKNAIKDIYNILRDGGERETRTDLNPDYVFEVHIGEEIKKYNYVVYVNDKNTGNFYDDENSFYISKNLDEKILENLNFIRKPRQFKKVYYKSILDVLEAEKEMLNTDNKVGLNIDTDVDCLKYIFSVDIENFGKDIEDIINNIEFTNNDFEKFDTIITVKNKGYDTKKFKTVITIDNKKDKIYETYYVDANYEYKVWKIDIGIPNEEPRGW